MDSPNTLCYRSHGLLGNKHVASKSVQCGVLSDEAKVAAERTKQYDATSQMLRCTLAISGQRICVFVYQLFLGWQPQNEMFFIWKK